MKRIFTVLSLLILLTQCNLPANESAESKAKSLVKKMTLEEKAGQMTQLTIEMLSAYDTTGALSKPHALDSSKLRQVIVDMGVGSILNVGGYTYSQEHWKEIIGSIQTYAKSSRLQIPVLYGIDAIHGANYTVGATLYPQQISLAATFDRELLHEMAVRVSQDVKSSGIPWNFSPVLDVGRNPMWPRFWETFGEDPYVVSELGCGMVKGYQEGDTMMAACLKHYVGYSDPRNGHDRTPAYIPERQLREIFLPPFANAIRAGAKTVMVNSSEWNGEPVHASHFLLTKVLREEMGFKGVAVTDWEDIKNLIERHHVAATYKEAVAMSINAGIDLAMVPLDLDFTKYLIENVKEDKIKESRIDEAVTRILQLKYELGLFENPVVNLNGNHTLHSEASKALSFELASEAIVLLKNQSNVLPFKADEKVLVTGPNADYLNALNGGWTHTWQGRDTAYNPEVNTILSAIKEEMKQGNVSYLKGNTYNTRLSDAELLRAAAGVSTVVLCLGEDTYTEKPGDINDLELENAQQELIQVYHKAGKKVVVVLVEGRPRTFASTEPMCDAILFAGLPGNAGGDAIAAILSGKVNPSGKLPFTYPRFSSTHSTYDCKYTELYDKEFKRNGFNPLYEFGSGLSYTQFNYSGMSISQRNLGAKDSIQMEVTVSNTGTIDGDETILVFSSDEFASITPSVKRLRAFKRVHLKAGEKLSVPFVLATKELSFVGLKNQFELEPGKFFFTVSNLKDSIEIHP